MSAPLRGRFGLVLRLDHYGVAELTAIVQRSAKLLGVTLDRMAPKKSHAAAGHAAHRQSPAAPRPGLCAGARRRSYRPGVPPAALDLLEVDRFGLDEIDQKIMLTLLKNIAAARSA